MLGSISTLFSSSNSRLALREQDILDLVTSLEEQLIALYEEKEKSAFQHTSTNTKSKEGELQVLRDSLLSMEEQLRALYAEREKTGDQSALREMVSNLEQQLVSLYQEKEFGSTFNGPNNHVSRIEAHYEALRIEYVEMIESLEKQLCCLYHERERSSPIASGALESMEEQLVALYSEKMEWLEKSQGVWEMVESLEQQVGALVDEKSELIAEINRLNRQIGDQQERARRLGAAVFEAALCGNSSANFQGK